jgi:hypothetical protein
MPSSWRNSLFQKLLLFSHLLWLLLAHTYSWFKGTPAPPLPSPRSLLDWLTSESSPTGCYVPQGQCPNLILEITYIRSEIYLFVLPPKNGFIICRAWG